MPGTDIDRKAPQLFGAIDVGSNSVRMVIAQQLPDGSVETLERVHRPVHLGQDTFATGRLSQETMNAAIAVLRDYRRMLESYHVGQLRAVATSAVREARNGDAFIDRIYMVTGLEVEVIEATEESRLTVSAVLDELGSHKEIGIRKGNVLIVDIGGGSALLTMLHRGEIAASGSHRLGSIRLQEMLSTTHESPDRAADILRHQIDSLVTTIGTSLELGKVRRFVAVGGDARFAAQQIGRRLDGRDLFVLDAEDFDDLVDSVAGHTAGDLARRYGLTFNDAETLVPALLAYQSLLHKTQSAEIIVSNVSMRDGLLLDLLRSTGPEVDEQMIRRAIQGARSVGEKYHYDAKHSNQVAELAGKLFDALQDEHDLSPRRRLLLRVAAIVHDIGAYVSNRAHHKHTYYLVVNSEIFGLRKEELEIVAQVARYHRRSAPKPAHLEYMNLPRDRRMTINKLAAVLRVADALDRGHSQQIDDVEFEVREQELVIHVPRVADVTLERRALADKADLFLDVYGRRVRLEEDDLPHDAPRRVRATEE